MEKERLEPVLISPLFGLKGLDMLLVPYNP